MGYDRFEDFYRYWNQMLEDWQNDPEKTFRTNVFLSKVNNVSKNHLYRKVINGKIFDLYKYRPEPYLGKPDDCCAVILNLNPGFGVSPYLTESSQADYKLQHYDAKDKIEYDAKEFVPYLNGKFVQTPSEIAKDNPAIPNGVFWWYGTYKKSAGRCTGGRIDYIHHMYELYFEKLPKNLPFALEICPWRSYDFNLNYIFPGGVPEDPNDDLIRVINDYVLAPALNATMRDGVLPFVLCIGSAITKLKDVLGLIEVKEWNQDCNDPDWPKKINKDNQVENVVRSYKLFQKEGKYLLNIFAPGSNKPPCKDSFKRIEGKILEEFKLISNRR